MPLGHVVGTPTIYYTIIYSIFTYYTQCYTGPVGDSILFKLRVDKLEESGFDKIVLQITNDGIYIAIRRSQYSF